MRLNMEQVLEKYIWERKIQNQQARVDTCLSMIIKEFKITKLSRRREKSITMLIEKVRRRIKMRHIAYKKNLNVLRRRGLCCDNLIQRWINARLIDPRDKRETNRLIRLFMERDFALANGLSNDQVPTDPEEVIHSRV